MMPHKTFAFRSDSGEWGCAVMISAASNHGLADASSVKERPDADSGESSTFRDGRIPRCLPWYRNQARRLSRRWMNAAMSWR